MARPEKSPPPSKTGGYLLAQWWRELRLGQKLDQHAVGQAIGCSPSHVSNIEQGRKLPSFELLCRFEDLVDGNGILRPLWEWAFMERQEEKAGVRPRSAGRGRPGDRSQFIRDLLPSNHSTFGPRERFIGGWELLNAGSVTWADRYIRQGGPAAPMYAPVMEQPLVPVPLTRPGETATIRVEMRAPQLPGDTIAYFHMVNADGTLCFPDRYAAGVYIRIHVREPIRLDG